MPCVNINITREGANPAQKSVGATDSLQTVLHKDPALKIEGHCVRVKAWGQSHG